LSKYPHTAPGREDILAVLRHANGRQNIKQIAKALHVKRSETEGLLRHLEEMERDGQIMLDKTGFYRLKDVNNGIVGQVSSHPDGYGFLIPDEGEDDIFLPEQEMQKVLHGDRVQIRIIGSDRRGRPEGTIVEVLSRANTHIVGRIVRENGVWLIVPEDRRITHDILVDEPIGNAKDGQIVHAELVVQPSKFTQPAARIEEVLGNIEDSGIEIEIAVRKFGLPHIFPKKTLELANNLPEGLKKEDYANRVDLRDISLVTIDGEDARDFDDAVYCEPILENGRNAFRLIVAIADVNHYVTPHDAIDEEALSRATSVYFPRRVIPMLPEKLSNGLCSLNPEVDRLVMVCDAVISEEGEIEAYQFYPAVMHSAARLTYTEVYAILMNPKGPEAILRGELTHHLQNLYALFKILFKARQERGAIDFETIETYIVSNAVGKIEKILPRVRNDAHKLIEECMLAANVCAADLLARHNQPALYRIHAAPSKEKLDLLRPFLSQLGLFLGGKDSPRPKDYAKLIGQIQGRPDIQLLQTMLLRSMQQAVYSPDNIGHFGLAFDAYTHFTSPIRRYPDLLVHRAIKAILEDKTYKPDDVDRRRLNKNMPGSARKIALQDKVTGRKKADASSGIWEDLGIHCSANERRADEASRDVEAWLKCYFMQDKLGEYFAGTISGVTPFGIFVQLDDLYVEGMVHITELGKDYFIYDEIRHELRGERSAIRYRLTDRVTVQISRINMDARQIDLHLITEQAKMKHDRQEKSNQKMAGMPVIYERYKKRGISNIDDREARSNRVSFSPGRQPKDNLAGPGLSSKQKKRERAHSAKAKKRKH